MGLGGNKYLLTVSGRFNTVFKAFLLIGVSLAALAIWGLTR